MLGDEVMIAPVYEQNARGRLVYLPQKMLFIREGKCIPVAQVAQSVETIKTDSLEAIGFAGSSYQMYEDDGIHKNYDEPSNYRIIVK